MPHIAPLREFGTDRYTLQPLIAAGRRALVCRDVEGLESVSLIELHIAHESELNDVEIRRAADVLLALEHQGRRLQDEEQMIRLVRAGFRIRFAGGKERTFVIEPPNLVPSDSNPEHAAIYGWLNHRGFISRG